MDLVYGILALVLSTVFFSILFEFLNMTLLHLFGPAQKFTSKLKGKKIYYYVVVLIIISSNIFIMDFFHSNYIKSGIVLGLLISLNEIIFNSHKDVIK